jgi:fructan beta-fructosidase
MNKLIITTMTHKGFFTLLISISFTLSLSAQVQTNEPPDKYRFSYQEVFDNIHYNQVYRPQVHYTPITGQVGDATGLIRYKGEYHLFYMYDEWSRQRSDNKNWGHATSHDCVFWEQKPQVLNTVIDNRPGSGSGILDWNNTLGLQSGVEKTIVLFYTDYGRGICIAFSRDAGNTWIRHKNNPVIAKKGERKDRDPLVFWYKPDQSWRMVLYEEPGFTFYKSVDLLKWDYLSKIDGFYECPDFLEVPVDGNPENKKWVIISADGSYRIGDFDGIKFIQETGSLKVDFGGDLYATQTWKQTYEGDGPFIQLASLIFQGQPVHNRTWSQQMCFPCMLTLKTINGKASLCRNPVDGIKQLRYDSHLWKNKTLQPGQNPLADLQGDVFEIIAGIDPDKATGFEFNIRGTTVGYDVKEQKLSIMGKKVTVLATNNSITLRFIIDRNSIEVFANQGEVTFSKLFYPEPSNTRLSLLPSGGPIKINFMEVYRLQSVWLKKEQDLGYFR